jgi:hypothetical protein
MKYKDILPVNLFPKGNIFPASRVSGLRRPQARARMIDKIK